LIDTILRPMILPVLSSSWVSSGIRWHSRGCELRCKARDQQGKLLGIFLFRSSRILLRSLHALLYAVLSIRFLLTCQTLLSRLLSLTMDSSWNRMFHLLSIHLLLGTPAASSTTSARSVVPFCRRVGVPPASRRPAVRPAASRRGGSRIRSPRHQVLIA